MRIFNQGYRSRFREKRNSRVETKRNDFKITKNHIRNLGAGKKTTQKEK
jgi:hypothetical protein